MMRAWIAVLALCLSVTGQAADFLHCKSKGTSNHPDFSLEEVSFSVTEIEGDENVYLSILPIFNLRGERRTEKFTKYLSAKKAKSVITGKGWFGRQKLNFDVQGIDLHTNGYNIELNLASKGLIKSKDPKVTIRRKLGGDKLDTPLTETLSCQRKNFFGYAKCVINDPTYAIDKFVLAAYEDPSATSKQPVVVKSFVQDRAGQIVSVFTGRTSIKKLESFGKAGNSESIDAKRTFAKSEFKKQDSKFFIPENLSVNFGERRKGLKQGDPDIRDISVSVPGGQAAVSATCAIQDATAEES